MRYSDLAGQLAAAHSDCDESENEAIVVVEIEGSRNRGVQWEIRAVGICNGGTNLDGRLQDEIIIEVEDEVGRLREENAYLGVRVGELERTIETMMGLRDEAVETNDDDEEVAS